MTPWILTHLWLIPGAPLLASFLILCFCGPRKTGAIFFAVAGQIVALDVSLTAFFQTLQSPGWRGVHNFTWFTFGDTPLRIGFLLDPLTAAMVVMITLVSLCIFVFSIGYMQEDPNFTRFFACLSFFSAAMLGLVVANSLLLLFMSWELVGLASYLLIGFWIHRPSAAAAAKKAFITTRIGDIGFFVGMLWLYGRSGTLLFYDGGKGCLEPGSLIALGACATTFISLLIFCGAIGKSGQFPLHVWLPDAMEGPTPVSALIHAATMVAAGVFLVARVYPLFSFGAIHGVTPALTTVVWIGTITSFMAGLIALAQPDIKRILAYSTVSQLGLMMVSLGVGGMAAGIMHLLAHGFFKALLFLGSGSVIHGCHHEQDIRKMGGLKKLMPVTFATYAIGMMALSGFPLLFSGAWTKEEILVTAWSWPVSAIPFWLLLAGVFFTALYMTRQMAYVFYGKPREAAAHAHESPPVMTIPLIVLAVCAVLFSFLLTPAWPWLESYLMGEKAEFHIGFLLQPIVLVSVVLVGIGVLVGARAYANVRRKDPLQEAQPGLYHLFENKFWIDEFYEHTLLAWSKKAANLADWMDRHIWDGCVRAVGKLGQLIACATSSFDEGGINIGVDQGCESTRDLGRAMSTWHSGQIQNYLRAIGIGMLALFILYVWLA